MKITFLGGGNMAVALVSGMLAKGHPPDGICVIELSAQNRERLSDRYGVRAIEAADDAAPDCGCSFCRQAAADEGGAYAAGGATGRGGGGEYCRRAA